MLSEIINISSGFQSSVNIAYDLQDDSKIDNFIATTSALELIDNVLSSVQTDSTQRAKILTGAYGRGKSHIVLVILSMLFRKNKKKVFDNILARLKNYNEDSYKLAKNFINSKIRLLPVIVSGSSSNLTQAFMNALQQSLNSNELSDIMPDTHFKAAISVIEKWKDNYPDTYKQFCKRISVSGKTFIKNLKDHNTDSYKEFLSIYPDLTSGSIFNPFVEFDVAELYEKVSIAIKSKGFSGLYIVYDEFGKYLETSISSATESDTKLLQDLAEKCNRSGKEQMHLMLICHKDISNYIDMNLPQDKVDGWRGISGRFEHINLHNNYSQMYEIIAAVIKKDEENWQEYCDEHIAVFDNLSERYTENFLIGGDYNTVKNTVLSCFPLHPSTMYILPRLSEKVAQNERTLFTFLSANHKNTLVEFIEKCKEDFAFVTPDCLYDYFEMQFRKELNSTEIFKTYQLASTVLRKVEKGSLESKIIKTIALIYIIEQFEKFPPTTKNITDVFIDSVDDPREITSSIENLIKKSCIVYLNRSNNYLKLKKTSGVDINDQINNRIETLKLKHSTKDLLNELSAETFLYPVKYNDEHCITRYFEFRFISCAEYFEGNFELRDKDAEGALLAVFFENASEFNNFQFEKTDIDNAHIITAIPKEYVDISSYVYEFKAVSELKRESADDDILSDEYDIYLEDIDVILNGYIAGFIRPETSRVKYYYAGEELKLYRKAQLSAKLSEICETTYPHTPLINNESINKNILSTTALNSRTKLINAILDENCTGESLGLTGTGQDVSFMRSTLFQTGVYRKENGEFSFTITPDDERMRNVLNIISRFFSDTALNGEISFDRLYHDLTSYEDGIGLKRGVIPVYIAVVLRKTKKDVVVRYKNEEVKITADLLNSINYCPSDYSVVMEDWNEDKCNYLTRLEDTFSEYIKEQEKNYNSFAYIMLAMNRWFVSLPRCAKEMKIDYKTEKALPKEYIRFANLLKQPSNNSRSLLITELPKAFGQENASLVVADSIAAAKAKFDNGKKLITQKAIDIAKATFKGKKVAVLSSVLKDWYDKLKRETIEHQFAGVENDVLSLISSGSNDEMTLITRIAKAVSGLRIDDWDNGSISKFQTELKLFKSTVDGYNSESHNAANSTRGTCRLTFTNDIGEEITRVFDRVEYSKKAKLLYNDISAAVEEMGQSVSELEKRQVLIEILEKLCM